MNEPKRGQIRFRLEIRSPQNLLLYTINSLVPVAVPPAGAILSFGDARERAIAGQQHWHFDSDMNVTVTVYVSLFDSKEHA